MTAEEAESFLSVGTVGAFVLRDETEGNYTVSYVKEDKSISHLDLNKTKTPNQQFMYSTPPCNNFFAAVDDLLVSCEKTPLLHDDAETPLNIKAAEKACAFHAVMPNALSVT